MDLQLILKHVDEVSLARLACSCVELRCAANSESRVRLEQHFHWLTGIRTYDQLSRADLQELVALAKAIEGYEQ